MKSIGDRLREARQARGLSQNKLSRMSGVSLSTINQLEKGVRGSRVGTEIVTKLVTNLSVHRSWFETGLGPRDTDAAADHADRYPGRALAVRVARDLSMDEEAIARVESMALQTDDDPPAEWWMGCLVDAGRELRDTLRTRKPAPNEFGDIDVQALTAKIIHELQIARKK